MNHLSRNQPDLVDASDRPWDLSNRNLAIALTLILLVAAGLLTKQIAMAKIASKDATGYYLPLAHAAAEGRPADAQSPAIPPAYPMAVAAASRCLWWVDDPPETAGRLLSALSAMGLVIVVYLLSREFGNRRVGVTAAGLTAANYAITHIGASVGPDMLYAFVLAAFAWLLIRHGRRARLVTAAAVGAVAGVAALVRSEGVFLPLFGAAVVAIRPVPRNTRAVLGRLAGVVVLIAIVIAIWWPRLSYMERTTGHRVLDVRLVSALEPHDEHISDDLMASPLLVASVGDSSQATIKTTAERLEEAQESLFRGVGYISWAFILLWALPGPRWFRGRPGHGILALLVTGQLAILATVALGKRYVATVAGPVQVWAALGAVTITERIKRKLPQTGRWELQHWHEYVATAGLVAALACVSLFSTNQDIRKAELRDVGRTILTRYGPGQIILATTPQPAYYADGRYVAIFDRADQDPEPSDDELRRICRDYNVRLIVMREAEPFSPWLLGRIRTGDLPAGALVASVAEDESVVHLVDVDRLFADPQGPGRRP